MPEIRVFDAAEAIRQQADLEWREFVRRQEEILRAAPPAPPPAQVDVAAAQRWMVDFEVAPAVNPAGGLRGLAGRLGGVRMVHGDPMPVMARTIENGQPLWDKILTAVREIYEPAYVCIAGGAIRDGKDAKDIDVFIHLPDDKFDPKAFMEQAEELGWKHIQKAGRVEPYLKDNKRGLTQAVCKGIVDGWQVDLIVTKATDGEKVVRGFDFHICEQWYDGETHRTKAAIFDMKKGHWTPSRALTTDTKQHFERVNKRLGGKYKLNTGEPWYMKFQGKEKLK